MFSAARAYRYWIALACALLCWLAPADVWATLSHRTTLPFPDRAQHAAQQDLSVNACKNHLASNPKHTWRVRVRDVGKAAAARRWVGASPSPFRLLGQVNHDDAELAWTRFRCFDADTGTWISTDPLEINGGLKL